MKKQNLFWKNCFWDRKERLKSFNKSSLKNNKGQVTVEYILLAVVLVTLFQLATMTLKNNKSLKNFQELPNQIFRDLVTNGTIEGSKNHPNHYDRYYTTFGDGEK